MKIKVNIDYKKIEAIGRENSKREAKESAERVYTESQERCPVDSGRLKNSGALEEVDGGYKVKYTEPYAVHVNNTPGKKGLGFLSIPLEKEKIRYRKRKNKI